MQGQTGTVVLYKNLPDGSFGFGILEDLTKFFFRYSDRVTIAGITSELDKLIVPSVGDLITIDRLVPANDPTKKSPRANSWGFTNPVAVVGAFTSQLLIRDGRDPRNRVRQLDTSGEMAALAEFLLSSSSQLSLGTAVDAFRTLAAKPLAEYSHNLKQPQITALGKLLEHHLDSLANHCDVVEEWGLIAHLIRPIDETPIPVLVVPADSNA